MRKDGFSEGKWRRGGGEESSQGEGCREGHRWGAEGLGVREGLMDHLDDSGKEAEQRKGVQVALSFTGRRRSTGDQACGTPGPADALHHCPEVQPRPKVEGTQGVSSLHRALVLSCP